jgi:hypothetical protein
VRTRDWIDLAGVRLSGRAGAGGASFGSLELAAEASGADLQLAKAVAATTPGGGLLDGGTKVQVCRPDERGQPECPLQLSLTRARVLSLDLGDPRRFTLGYEKIAITYETKTFSWTPPHGRAAPLPRGKGSAW